MGCVSYATHERFDKHPQRQRSGTRSRRTTTATHLSGLCNLVTTTSRHSKLGLAYSTHCKQRQYLRTYVCYVCLPKVSRNRQNCRLIKVMQHDMRVYSILVASTSSLLIGLYILLFLLSQRHSGGVFVQMSTTGAAVRCCCGPTQFVNFHSWVCLSVATRLLNEQDSKIEQTKGKRCGAVR